MAKKYILPLCAVSVAALLLIFAVALGYEREEAAELGEGGLAASEKSAGERYTVLVSGKDVASGLCDVIMLVSIDPSNNKINVLQIPRDTYAEYADKSYNKLNGAMSALGSADAFRKYLSGVLGVNIDATLTLDTSAFRAVVDALGGVEVELDEPLYYSDPTQKLYIDLPAGRQTLDGKGAEMLVRYRSGYGRGDIDRLDVQKSFLASLFESFKDRINKDNAYGVASELIERVQTDIPLTLGVALVIEALAAESEDVCFFTLPGEAIVSKKSGASYYVMSAPSTQRLLCEYFGKESALIDTEQRLVRSDYEDFVAIYESEYDLLPIRADELDRGKIGQKEK